MFASIRKTILATVAAASVLGATSIAAQAGQEFSILNDTGVDLEQAFITPETVDHWGRNMLDGGVFRAGKIADVEMTSFGDACVYDMLFVAVDGEEFDYRGVDVCTYPDLTIQ